ncbi:hypothetical protein GEV33_010099 [Tenebrio molitor]|uniref:Uncharacterized protein n=1 Tax=Tenebrio molitor TaxID=7067 RepID=A0A8J6LGU9_TENMO|nr:hypothetical protein GEV33_010099 [Tenebrio molitor]
MGLRRPQAVALSFIARPEKYTKSEWEGDRIWPFLWLCDPVTLPSCWISPTSRISIDQVSNYSVTYIVSAGFATLHKSGGLIGGRQPRKSAKAAVVPDGTLSALTTHNNNADERNCRTRSSYTLLCKRHAPERDICGNKSRVNGCPGARIKDRATPRTIGVAQPGSCPESSPGDSPDEFRKRRNSAKRDRITVESTMNQHLLHCEEEDVTRAGWTDFPAERRSERS